MPTEPNPQMDWQQVALNGGPPCFAVNTPNDLPNRYCGRAERWEGHGSSHDYVSLDDLLNAERERCAKLEKHVYMEYEAQTISPQAKKIASEVCRLYAAVIRGKD